MHGKTDDEGRDHAEQEARDGEEAERGDHGAHVHVRNVSRDKREERSREDRQESGRERRAPDDPGQEAGIGTSVGDHPAHPVTEGEARHHDADEGGPDDQGGAHVGGDDAGTRHLQDHHARPARKRRDRQPRCTDRRGDRLVLFEHIPHASGSLFLRHTLLLHLHINDIRHTHSLQITPGRVRAGPVQSRG